MQPLSRREGTSVRLCATAPIRAVLNAAFELEECTLF